MDAYVDLTIHALTATELHALANDIEFCVKLDNPVPNVEDMTVEFDVMAKSSVPGLKFARAEVIIDYPTGNLGEFIVDQEKIEAKKGDITDSPAYTVNVKDQTKEQVGLTIESPCDNEEPHYVLDTVYEKLATLTIEVNEWGDFGTMNVNDFAVDGTAEFVNPATFQGTPGCTEFDDLCGEGEFPVVPLCAVSSVSGIYNAGVNQTLRLTGSGFGDATTSQLYIPNANTGGITNTVVDANNVNFIKSWSDTEIQVNVSSVFRGNVASPTPAGSGDWRVVPFNSAECRVPIEVGYSVSSDIATLPDGETTLEERYFQPITSLQKIFNVDNGTSIPEDGALHVYLNSQGLSSFLALSNIQESKIEEVIQDVICKWEESLGVEIMYEGIIDQPIDIPSMIRIDLKNLGPDEPEVARTINRFNGDDLCGIEIFSYWDSAIIEINTAYLFAFVDAGSFAFYDFETILLHEFGHALLQNHANDPESNGLSDSRTMFYKRNTGVTYRDIDIYGKAGASDIGAFSIKHTTISTSDCTKLGGISNALVLSIDDEPEINCGTSAIHGELKSSDKLFVVDRFSSDVLAITNISEENLIIKVYSSSGQLFTEQTIRGFQSILIKDSLPRLIFLASFSNRGSAYSRSVLRK